MRFLKTNTAVIISVGPFYDKTDGVTPETALTITNERITLVADTDDNSAPTLVLDNVTGATSGTSNDLNYITGQDNGMMQMELSAANTNRLGRMILTITDAANHVPVFHEFMVLPAMIYDAFILGTDTLHADMQQILGTAVSTPATAGILDVNVKNIDNDAASASGTVTFPNATLASTTNITAGTITTATNVTTVNGLAANVITAAATASDFGTEIAAAVWDRLTSALTVVGSIGKLLVDNVNATISSRSSHSAADVWAVATRILTAATNITSTGGTTVPQTGDSFARLGAPAGASVSADIATRASQASVDTVDGIVDAILVDTAEIGAAGVGLTNINLPDQAMNITGNITGNLSGSVGSVTGNVGGNVVGSVGSVVGLTVANLDVAVSTRLASGSYTAPNNAGIAAIKLQTDKFTFTVANMVDSNIQFVNDVQVTGNGQVGTEWGP